MSKKDYLARFSNGVALHGQDKFQKLPPEEIWCAPLFEEAAMGKPLDDLVDKISEDIRVFLSNLSGEVKVGEIARDVLIDYLINARFSFYIIEGQAVLRVYVGESDFGIDILLDEIVSKDIGFEDMRSTVEFWRNKFAEYVALCDERLASGELLTNTD